MVINNPVFGQNAINILSSLKDLSGGGGDFRGENERYTGELLKTLVILSIKGDSIIEIAENIVNH